MRTTIDIEDDVLATARSLARQNEESLGATVSALLRRALDPSLGVAYSRDDHGFPVFEVRDGAPLITNESVREALLGQY